MKLVVLLSGTDAFFSPMSKFADMDTLTKSSIFADLIEAIYKSYDSYDSNLENEEYDDYSEYYKTGEDYDDSYYADEYYEEPVQSIYSRVAATFHDFSPSLRTSTNASRNKGCSVQELERRNQLATLICPEVKDGVVKAGTPCSWQCKDGFKFGNKHANNVKCEGGGSWTGVKKVKCNAGCKWAELKLNQRSGSFQHCKNDGNFGDARYKCKVGKKLRSGNDHRGVRCMCKNSRQNSGKCDWRFF